MFKYILTQIFLIKFFSISNLYRYINSKKLRRINSVASLSTKFDEREKKLIIEVLGSEIPNGIGLDKLIKNLNNGIVPDIFKKPKENEKKLQQNYKCKFRYNLHAQKFFIYLKYQ